MSQTVFRSWDWERDTGCDELPLDQPAPRSHAVAFFDDRGLVYRVVARNPQDILPSDGAANDEEYAYDYYCDDAGRIREKRSLDDAGRIVLIVRYEYDATGRRAEVGWSPASATGPKRIALPL
jgi:hypothetical protein